MYSHVVFFSLFYRKRKENRFFAKESFVRPVVNATRNGAEINNSDETRIIFSKFGKTKLLHYQLYRFNYSHGVCVVVRFSHCTPLCAKPSGRVAGTEGIKFFKLNPNYYRKNL